MNQAELESIVELITKQVLAGMGKCEDDSCPDGYKKMLLIGKCGRLIPEELCRDTTVYDIKDYQKYQNILRYDRVCIAKLSMTQLVDLAQGRVSDDETSAVIYALLNGIDVVLLEYALPHRKYAGKGSTALYKQLEGYAQTLQMFGIKPYEKKVKDNLPPPPPPKFKAPPVEVPAGSAKPSTNRLITEVEARELIQQGEGIVYLPVGAIVTPLARDIFAAAKVELKKE